MAERAELLLPHIPYPQLYAPEAVEYQLTRDILMHPDAVNMPTSADNDNEKPLVSPIDLRRSAAQMSDQEILDAVSTHLGTSFGILDSVPKTRDEIANLEKKFEDINTALVDAGRYIHKVLAVKVPTAEVHSRKDIVELIRKTALYKETNKKGLERHAGYCALVSVALAVFELQKKASLFLAGEMDYLARFLTEQIDANGGHPLFSKHTIGDIGETINVIVNRTDPPCRGRLSMRDKTPDSQTTKYLRKPEATAEAAQNDAIGLRLEIKNDRIEDVVVCVLNYLQEQMNATNLEVEDKHLLAKDKNRLEDLKVRISEEVHNGNAIPATPNKSKASASSYRGVNITFRIQVRRGGTSNEFVTRDAEIQLVEPENKQTGLASTPVYELRKKVIVMTRLFGGCSHAWIVARAKEIARTEGFADEFVSNTITGLQDEGFLMQLPDTPKKTVYAATEVYGRWLKVRGLIDDPAVRKLVIHGLGLKSDPLDERLKTGI